MNKINKKLITFTIFALGFFPVFGNTIQAKSSDTNEVPQSISVAPTIISTTASQITSTSAILNGSVNPNGTNTDVWFHVGTPLNPSLGSQNIGNGISAVTLNPFTLTDLTPGTSYYFRIETSNINGNAYGSWVSFTTLSSNGGGGSGGGGGGGYIIRNPNVTTQNATNISKYSAVLNGTINPNYRDTTVWFEYGTSPLLLSFNQTNHIPFGNSSSYSILSQNITNLNPNTTYYFRAVGSNISSTIRGSILSFTTISDTIVVNNTIIKNNPPKPIYQDSNTISKVEKKSLDNQVFPKDNYFDNKNLSATALYSSKNILPKTALGWLLLLLLILIIIIIARELYEDSSYQKSKNKISANHIENLPT